MKSNHSPNRFEIDDEGFKQQMKEINPFRLCLDMVQNCVDEKSVTNFSFDIAKTVKHGGCWKVKIKDDGNGFMRISDTFTLFGDSYKRSSPEYNGMFNAGEKQFIAPSIEAEVLTQDQKIVFPSTGGRSETTLPKKHKGTEVTALFDWSEEEVQDIVHALHQVIVKERQTFTVNGEVVEKRKPIKTFKAKLDTLILNEKGQLVPRFRECKVELYEKKNPDAWIFSIGIPVCELKDEMQWDINVKQRVPVPPSRDVIGKGYADTLYKIIVEKSIDLIDEDTASDGFINIAMKNTSKKISAQILIKKYGTDQVMIESKTDSVANERAEKAGYHLVRSGELNQEIRDNLKEHELIDYAGQKFATSAFEFARTVEPTDDMTKFAKICELVAQDVINKKIDVYFVTTSKTTEVAQYGSRNLTWNVRTCGGKKAFVGFSAYMIGVLVHELAHDKFGNNEGYAHFSHEFFHEMERIAGLIGYNGIDHWSAEILAV